MDPLLCQHDCAYELWRILFRFDFVSIKSIPHRAVGVLLFWCCCFYSCYCFLWGCVIIFVQSWFFVLFFLLSVLVSSCGGRVCIFCIQLFTSLSPLEILRCVEIILIDSSWSLVSHVPVLLFPVSAYLLFLFHPVIVPFFFARCRRLALTAALSACFFANLVALSWNRKNYRFDGSWSTARNYRDCHGTFLFRCLLR